MRWGRKLAICLLIVTVAILLVRPVSADTWKAIYTNNTLNAYTESSSTTKTTAYNATTGTIRNYSPTTYKSIFAGTNETYASLTTTYRIMRGYLFFPTGNYIPMTANISKANLSINVTYRGTTGTLYYLNISGNGSYILNPGTQPFTSIAPPHYAISTRDHYRRNYIEDIDSSITTGGSPAQTLITKIRTNPGSAEAYNNISITSDGRNLIRKGGSNVSAIVLRTSRDIWSQAQSGSSRYYHLEIVGNKSTGVGVSTSNNYYTPILWVYYHTPPDEVLYNTTLRKSGDSGETSITGPINGSRPLRVVFADYSTGDMNNTAHYWDAGDGNTLNLNESSAGNYWNKVYDVPGVYTVSHNVTAKDIDIVEPTRTQWTNLTDWVVVQNKNATMWWNISANGVNPPVLYGNTTTKFYAVDRSLGTNLTDPASYYYNWTDGNVTVKQNATHIFPVKDEEYSVWNVTHNTTEDVGTPWQNTTWLNITENQIRVFHNATPNMTFSADVTSGSIPLVVTFTSTDVGHIKTDYWCWTFGDGGISSGEQNPVHTYTSTGTYDVHLFAGNYTLGVGDTVRIGYIEASPGGPTAAWNATIYGIQTNTSGYGLVNGTKDAKIQLVDSSSNTPTSWLWTLNTSGNVPFNSSTNQNWNAVIKVPGLYSVNFSATNDGGTSWLNRSDFILVRNVNATILWNISANGANPEITYGNTSTNFYTVDKTSGTNLTDPGSYFWNWTDGNLTVKKNALHKFPVGAEEYRYWEVAHNVTEDVGTPWANTTWYNMTNVVRVFHNATPNVTLTADVTSGSTPLVVTFTTTDIGHIKTDYWCWTFGDGGISSGEQNPVHTYTSAGTYTVHLVAGNYTMGLTDFVRTNYITATTAPTAAWNATLRAGGVANMSGYGILNGTRDAKIGFVDMSSDSPTSWLWTLNTSGNVPFNSSTDQNWNAVIKVPGLYSVNFSATNAGGTSWLNRSNFIIVQNKNATAIFDVGTNSTTVNISTAVHFIDRSSGTNLSGWMWDFGDKNISLSQNGTHNYSVTGWYTIGLNATEDAGTPWQNISGWSNKTGYIHIINNTPNNTFWSDVQTGAPPLTVTFTEAHNQTVENYTWLFVASDGSIEFTDRNQTPVYIFKNTGTYSVNYSVMNYENVVWFNRSAFITVSNPPVTDFSCTVRDDNINFDTYCEDSSTNSPTSYFWSVENGTIPLTSNVKNPIFNITFADMYNVNHSSTNAGGTDWENKTGYIIARNSDPAINWNNTPDYGNRSTTFYLVDWSTGNNITGFWWNFTDGTQSDKRNTTHQFSKWVWPDEYKYYDIEHNVTQDGGTPWNSTWWQNTTFLTQVRIFHNDTPTSTFIESATTGERHLPVTFTNVPVGHIVQDYWLWYFDGEWGINGTNWSSLENPMFIYERAGLYSVLLYSGNYTLGNGTVEHVDRILVYNTYPTNLWTTDPAVPTTINTSTEIQFIDGSSGVNISGPTASNWSFGDFNVSYGHTPRWVYNITGQYTINHSITDSPGTAWARTSWNNISNAIYVVNDTVHISDFTVLPVSGERPLSVTTTLTSDGGRIMYCNWSWGDGNITNGSTWNPSFTYTVPGTYSVNVSCGNDAGSIKTDWSSFWINKSNYVTVTEPLPIVRWNATPNETYVGYTVTFVDNTSSDALAWGWYVNGDDVIDSATMNTTWLYGAAGAYNINHSASNLGGTAWLNRSEWVIIHNTAPIVRFNITPEIANISTLVYFVDTSSGENITNSQYTGNFNWSFGDGNVSSNWNITHRFPSTGLYLINHSVTDSPGTKWSTVNWSNSTIRIVNNSLTVDWTSNETSGNVPFVIQFNDTSTGGEIENYTWILDGNSTYTDKNLSFEYTSVGVWNVNHSVCNDAGCWWDNRSNYITAYSSLVADFNATPRYGTVTQEVVFVDMSTGDPTSWWWDIDGDDILDSTKQNYTHTYADAGAYTINHNATRGSGTSWDNRSYYIIINNTAPIVIWNGTPTTVNLSTLVYFVDSSTGINITAWNWSFDDGNVSSSRNTTHRFPETGWYDILHNTTDSDGTLWNVTNGTMESSYIHVINNTLTAGAFTCAPVSGDRPVSVSCTDATTGGAVMNYTWIFDGNNQTSEKDPTFLYDVVGTFSVNHSACNDAGCVWYNRSDYITITQFVPAAPPVADWNATPRYGTAVQNVVFVDMSTGGEGTSWWWDVDGDGVADSLNRNYTHTYTVAGAYSVAHNVTNTGGTSWDNRSLYIIINNTEPVIDWIAAPLNTDTITPVVFNDTSTGTNITRWYWHFGDLSTSSSKNTTHTYSSFGQYTVIHNITDSYGTLWNRTISETRVNYITVGNSTITPAFSCSPLSGAAPLDVTCTDGSTGGPAWNWSWILDGNTTSHVQNPSHTYTMIGKWNVNFSSCNDIGCVYLNKSDYITTTEVGAGTGVNLTLNITPPGAIQETIEWRPLNDFRIWILFAIASFGFLIISHVSPRGNDIFAVLAIICAVTSTWGTIGLAIYNDPITVTTNITRVNATYNGSVTIAESIILHPALYIGSPWLTLFFAVFSIITLLNLIYIYVEVIIPYSMPKQRGMRPPQQVGTQELPDIEVENGYYDEWGNHRKG